MKSRILLCLVAVALIAATYSSVQYGTQKYLAGLKPRIEAPEAVELGEHMRGEIAIGRLSIANRGSADLVVDGIHSSCACGGLEEEVDGRLVRVTSLRLPPGQEANLVIRVSVNGQPGRPRTTVISYRTNDPDCPNGSIQAVVPNVKAGVTVTPTSVCLAPLLVGGQARLVLQVRDPAANPAKIARVTSSNPDLLTVRLLDKDSAHEPVQEGNGTPLRQVELTLHGRNPQAVNEQITIQLDDEARPATVVPVAGRITALVEVSPSSLVLPRASSAGPIYNATCTIRSAAGKAFALKVASTPPGISARVSEAVTPAETRTIRIEWDHDADPCKEREAPRVVRLLADVDGETVTLNIVVHCVKEVR